MVIYFSKLGRKNKKPNIVTTLASNIRKNKATLLKIIKTKGHHTQSDHWLRSRFTLDTIESKFPQLSDDLKVRFLPTHTNLSVITIIVYDNRSVHGALKN